MSDTLFELFRGDDYALRVVITDDTDTPIDITGWSFKATMKLTTEMPDDQAPVKVDIPAVSGTDASLGVLYLDFPAEQTADLLPTSYFLDLQRELGGKVSTIFVEKVKVKPDVTRRTA